MISPNIAELWIIIRWNGVKSQGQNLVSSHSNRALRGNTIIA
jgi:hypothetical protein